jgi:hypothetical protein
VNLLKIIIVSLLATVFWFEQGLESKDVHPSVQKESLLRFSHTIYSQRGEEGILTEILKRLGIKMGFFVEFGAWDGIYLSNTKFLADKGWPGAFIESDSHHYQELTANYNDLKKILCINEFVTWDEKDSRGKTFDQIADQYFPHQEIDYLSIDIDGADYLILENLKRKPKIICVEGGFSWHPLFEQRVPDEIAFQNLQQPLAVVIEIAKKQGYEALCFTQNTFLIRRDLYAPFAEIKNDALSLWRDAWHFYPEIQAWLVNWRTMNHLIRQCEGPEFCDLNL